MKKDNLHRFALAALDANGRIAPFAYALLTEEIEGEEDGRHWPVVLIHSIPLGDFSEKELDCAMRSLVEALVGSRQVLSVLTEDV